MLKELKYGGFTAQPSDYSCPDGDLALSLNLINEDGGLRPLEGPTPRLYLSNGETLLLIHKVTGQENYILFNGSRLSWMKRKPDYISSKNSKEIYTNGSLPGYKAISAVGNTLCVSTANGVEYILWKDGNYKYLGSRPPFLSIRFGCHYVGELNAEVTVPGSIPLALRGFLTSNGAGGRTGVYTLDKESIDFWHTASDTVMGELLSWISNTVHSKGLVCMPFFIRYAFRLYDGSYFWHSAPILMLPTTMCPVIHCKVEDDRLKFSFDSNNFCFEVAYRIMGDTEALKDWTDIIAGIDVFFSAPIYTFEQEATESYPKRLYTLFEGYTNASAKYYMGTFAAADVRGPYEEHFASNINEMLWVFGLKRPDGFDDNLKHRHIFYKVASLEIEETKAMAEMKALKLDKTDLNTITTLDTLPDDYNSHATILPEALHAYNHRLIMTDLAIKPPVPFPTIGISQALDATESTLPTDMVRSVKVYTRINGSKCVSTYVQDEFVDPFPLGKVKPRYLYHPDPSAFMMEIYTTGATYRYNLKPHPYLNGAYWFGGLTATPAAPIAEAESTTTTEVAVGNKVYISQVNNPFLFPAESIVTIDCGRIFRLSTAAKALSQGQFGQFPLYAFTDDGVWALEVASTGVISARQPITRDVCINPDGITQIDSAVLFPTDRGIMLISGSQTLCISDPVNALEEFSLSQFQGFSKVLSGGTSLVPDVTLLPPDEFLPVAADAPVVPGQPGVGVTDIFPNTIEAFNIYLKGCRMVYDYPHQHIFVFNPSYGYFYVYSLKSQAWGMAHGRLKYALNSYPEGMAVDNKDRLLDFSTPSGSRPRGVLLSRPLKLDYPDVLKTVDTVIQRGLFKKGKVKSVLYGSRDMYNWFPVWSSVDHFLRGFRGSPYKYFRIALGCALGKGETVSGAIIKYQPRYTNKPR